MPSWSKWHGPFSNGCALPPRLKVLVARVRGKSGEEAMWERRVPRPGVEEVAEASRWRRRRRAAKET